MKPLAPQHDESPWPHRVAVLLACVTFPLIWVGGLVTTYDAGMAVPDWPSTYGYNLLLYPWKTWVFGPFDLFIEHGHRLLGALAGLISIGLVVVSWATSQRAAIRWGAVGALALVILQGVLGGLRVLLDERTLALIHGCVGPAFLAYVVVLASVSSRWWREHAAEHDPTSARFTRLALVTVAIAYFQLVLGAHVRHAQPDASPESFRIAVYFHLGTAFVLAAHAFLLAMKSRSVPAAGVLRRPAMGIALMILLQMTLGGAVWVLKYGWPFLLSESLPVAGGTVVANSLIQATTTTAHVALGALILATSALLAARTLRYFRVERGVLAQVSTKWEAAP